MRNIIIFLIIGLSLIVAVNMWMREQVAVAPDGPSVPAQVPVAVAQGQRTAAAPAQRLGQATDRSSALPDVPQDEGQPVSVGSKAILIQ